ncbi:MAG: M61 family metallopeptidase [Candidatus Kariarchaeaceae archaeon]
MVTTVELDVTRTHAHLVSVKMRITTLWDNPLLEMPSWTPGSYLIRDYSRHVQEFEVSDENGNTLPFQKVSKNNWQVIVSSNTPIIINYLVYAFELTVRTSYLDDRKALISPASVFMYQKHPENEMTSKTEPIQISFSTPDGWQIFTSLKYDGKWFIAEDFDELVDSPIGMGVHNVVDHLNYEIEGNRDKPIPCDVVIIGDKGNHDIHKFSEDLKRIQRYIWMLYIVGKGGGGLEHKYSNCSIFPRWKFNDPKSYTKLMSLEIHEHFHAYNIKRIRPLQLGPFDYSNEVYTRLLWVAEGLTRFYDRVLLSRGELIPREEYWQLVADMIKELDGVPGRSISSLSEASFDAWIKLYKPDENTINTSVNYYLKGGLVGLLLDLDIRKQTNWTKSLDTFFAGMYKEYKINPSEGYPENEFKSLLEKFTETDLDEFWEKYIDGVAEFDYNSYLNLIGMELITTNEADIAHFGVIFEKGTTTVNRVHANSPAMHAGIYAKDEIIAINGYQATKDILQTILKDHTPGENISIHLFRDSKLLELTIQPTEAIPDKYEIKPLDPITEEQERLQNLFFKI